MDQHMGWLLDLAANIRSRFYDKRVSTLTKEYLQNVNTPAHSVITDTIVNNSTCPIFIVASDPKQVFYDIIEQIRNNESEQERALFKPITLITKLANKEFMLDINGERMIYGVSAKFSNNNLIKSLICRSMYYVKNYFDLVNSDTHTINPEVIEILDHQYSFEKDGGKSKKTKKASKSRKSTQTTPRVNIKVKILSRLITYVKSNQILMGSLIYLNTMADVDNHALDIIYSDNRSKDAVMDYLKLLISSEYKDFSFEYNPHQGFFVPFDFRIRKMSCYTKHKKSGQNNYLVNLYNAAMYDPIPCYRLVESENVCQMMAHPLVKLRFLYLDLYFLNSKNAKNEESLQKAHNTFETILLNLIESAHSELAQVSKTPTWVGIFRDEGYDRNQENMKQKIEVPFEVIII